METMKRLTRFLQALFGIVPLMFTALAASGRLAWNSIRNWWTGCPKWMRRMVVTILIIMPAGYLACVAYELYDDMYGRNYYWDKKLSSDIMMYSFSDDKWRVYDVRADRYTTGKLNWISGTSADDSLAVYAIPNRRGYINVNTGRIVIDAELNEYSNAWVFSDGMAAVVKDGKVGFVNALNEVVIPFKFDYADNSSMYDFAYVFRDGYCVMTGKDGRVGLIDSLGNWVIEPVYDEIFNSHDSGCRVVVKDGVYGIVDSEGTVLYPAEYCSVDIFADGIVLVKDGRKWQVDFEGNVVQPFMFDGTYYLKYPDGYDNCGYLTYVFADYIKYEVMGSYGIMHRFTGEPLTPALYADVNMLSKELFEVQTSDGFDWYLLDTRGNVVSKK